VRSSLRHLAPLVVLVAGFAAAFLVAGPAAAPDRKPPRIVAAALQDTNGNSRADRLLLTYSEPVRHARNASGRHPFTVAGYRIRSVGRASGRKLVLTLVEKAAPDHTARPAVRYRRAKARTVRDRAGNQAATQLFRATRAHGRAPGAGPASPPPPPRPGDADGDGYPDAQDCAPNDHTIHPGAPDLPDLAFVDSNCDGIDGTEANAVFASPAGSDANPGTRAAPKRQIDAAVAAAAASGRYVLAAAGTYGSVEAQKDVGVYGGYDEADWSRRGTTSITRIVGIPQGVRATGATGVVLQLLTVHADSPGTPGSSAYGIRATGASQLTLQRVTVTAGAGAAGADGVNAGRGLDGAWGGDGQDGICDSIFTPPTAGLGASSPIGRAGGKGGSGGASGGTNTGRGQNGEQGQIGTPGGAGGTSGTRGNPGTSGQNGTSGAVGARGAGGTSTTALAGLEWRGAAGVAGAAGTHGNGGGGGGGGGAQRGALVLDGPGNGGGGGGAGGAGGPGGTGGGFGGGSFGIYLHDSSVVLQAGSTIYAGNGGVGGRGGSGGPGGFGGAGGRGARHCTSEIGAGGDGGQGGSGGQGAGGGGGAGGPSVGIMRAGTPLRGGSTATVSADSTVSIGTGGRGGVPGQGGVGAPGASQNGIAQVNHSTLLRR
jgi:hypothetical protein